MKKIMVSYFVKLQTFYSLINWQPLIHTCVLKADYITAKYIISLTTLDEVFY